MSKSSYISILSFLLIFLCPFRSPAIETHQEKIDLLTDSFIEKLDSVFPPVELFVIGVTPSPDPAAAPENQYKISLEPTAKVKIFPGMEFDLVRRGKPYKHPLTGVILGYFNRKLGVVRIKRYSPDFLECYPVTPISKDKVKVGDLARITSKTIPISILLTGSFDKSSLLDELLFKTGNRERFKVSSPEKVEKTAQKLSISEKVYSAAKVKDFCSKLGVRALVIWKVSGKKDNLVSRIKIFSAVTGQPMVRFFLSI